jgi:hypothetical protein
MWIVHEIEGYTQNPDDYEAWGMLLYDGLNIDQVINNTRHTAVYSDGEKLVFLGRQIYFPCPLKFTPKCIYREMEDMAGNKTGEKVTNCQYCHQQDPAVLKHLEEYNRIKKSIKFGFHVRVARGLIG